MPIPILICDDSAMARKQLARALPPGQAFAVEFAADGVQALAALRENPPALLLLDLTMPELDGYGVLETMAAEGLATPVVVVSGDIQPGARERVLELGGRDFLRKPLDPAELAAVLRRLGLTAAPGGGRAADAPVLAVDALDCYREVANVAMGQAASLLARLLDVFVILPVPNVNQLEVGELVMALNAAERAGDCSAICQGFIGSGIAGEALLIFNDDSFADLARLMKYPLQGDPAGELEALLDIGNILIGACLKGIADQLDIRFSQGHPVVLGRHCRIDELVAANRSRWRKTLAIEINYGIRGYAIDCDLLLLFTEDSIPVLNEKLAHLIDD